MTPIKTGIIGFCWGGKKVILEAANAGKYVAAGSAHPSFFEAADAENVSVPMCVLPSKDEPPLEDVRDVCSSLPPHRSPRCSATR